MKLWLTTSVAIGCAAPAAAQVPDWSALENEALATLQRYISIDASIPAVPIIHDTVRPTAGR
jgi:hypothetical protein